MVGIDKADIAKLRKEGKNFEIFVVSEKAVQFKAGKPVNIQDVVVTEEIFYDAKKGTRASEHELKKIFGTDNKLEVCAIIIKEGHVPVTAEMMKNEVEQKHKLIVNIIHRNAVDPSTGKPHPATRIENAMHEAKVKLDSRPAEQQVADIIKQLRNILPIKYETRELLIVIPAQYAAKAFGTLKQFGKLLAEKWGDNGSLNATLEIPAGMQEDLELALNNLTKGNVDIQVLRSK